MRFFVEGPLVAGASYTLPPGATRHAQVRRVQPGDALADDLAQRGRFSGFDANR